jgi:hypothetical protein
MLCTFSPPAVLTPLLSQGFLLRPPHSANSSSSSSSLDSWRPPYDPGGRWRSAPEAFQLTSSLPVVSSFPLSSLCSPPLPSQLTADDFNYANSPRPFKNPYFTRGAATVGARKNKALKQVLALERERIDRILEERKAAALAKVDEELGMETEDESVHKQEERRRRKEEAIQGVIGDVVSCAFPPLYLPLSQ